MREYVRVGTNAYICLYVHTCMYEYVYANMIVRLMLAYENACACLSVRLFVCVYVCLYVCMYICLYVFFYICMHVRACVCVYVYTYVGYFFPNL